MIRFHVNIQGCSWKDFLFISFPALGKLMGSMRSKSKRFKDFFSRINHLHPGMLAHGYTKWWFVKGISFQIGLVWVSVLDFWAVHVVIIWFSDHLFTSNRISCTQSDRVKPSSDNLIIDRWNNHQSQVRSRTEKVIKHDLHVSSGLFWLFFDALILQFTHTNWSLRWGNWCSILVC